MGERADERNTRPAVWHAVAGSEDDVRACWKCGPVGRILPSPAARACCCCFAKSSRCLSLRREGRLICRTDSVLVRVRPSADQSRAFHPDHAPVPPHASPGSRPRALPLPPLTCTSSQIQALHRIIGNDITNESLRPTRGGNTSSPASTIAASCHSHPPR